MLIFNHCSTLKTGKICFLPALMMPIRFLNSDMSVTCLKREFIPWREFLMLVSIRHCCISIWERTRYMSAKVTSEPTRLDFAPRCLLICLMLVVNSSYTTFQRAGSHFTWPNEYNWIVLTIGIVSVFKKSIH